MTFAARAARPGPAPSARPRKPLASAQETTLDLLWVQHAVACFAGGRRGGCLYVAVLSLEGPPYTPRALAAADPGALGGYRAVLDGLDHPLQILVRAEAYDASAYAARWEARAAVLVGPLAVLAREHAAWARRQLARLGVLDRRAYLVVPADDHPTDQLPRPGQGLRVRLQRGPLASPGAAPPMAAERACATLDERCARLTSALGAAGVAASRLGDLALATLYRDCWSRNTANLGRQDTDLATLFERNANAPALRPS